MVCIFDEAVREQGAVKLLADALISLARQWVFHPGLWKLVAMGLGNLLFLLFCGFLPHPLHARRGGVSVLTSPDLFVTIAVIPLALIAVTLVISVGSFLSIQRRRAKR